MNQNIESAEEQLKAHKNKTVLDELLNWIKDEENQIGTFIETEMIEYKIKQFLSKERKQMVNSFAAGRENINLYAMENGKYEVFGDYYEQNFE